MNRSLKAIRIWLAVALLPSASVYAQKVNVGYDKGADFSRYGTYMWATPPSPPTRPLLYMNITDGIDSELEGKGFSRLEKDGDLILIPAGGVDLGINNAGGIPLGFSPTGAPPAIDATMWTGSGGVDTLTAAYVPEGTFVLTVVDRRANKVIWTGSVKQKLDIEQKNKSLELVNKAIAKLMKEFPPKKK